VKSAGALERTSSRPAAASKAAGSCSGIAMPAPGLPVFSLRWNLSGRNHRPYFARRGSVVRRQQAARARTLDILRKRAVAPRRYAPRAHAHLARTYIGFRDLSHELLHALAARSSSESLIDGLAHAGPSASSAPSRRRALGLFAHEKTRRVPLRRRSRAPRRGPMSI